MAILRRRNRTAEPRQGDGTAPTRQGAATAPGWHGPTRAVMTLLAVGVAGLLAWLTTNINDHMNGGYWAVYGILAGAGLVMALSQLLGGWTKWGRPRLSPTVFLLAFVPTLIAVGWIVVFNQPHGNTFRSHVVSWSGDLGIDGFVKSMGGDLLTMLSFGLGLVFGLSFDTRARRAPTAPTTQPVSRPATEPAASEPMTRERQTAERQTVRS